ncbi:hypothetical protein Hanom_Chr03g00241951 [Helianthus anomalus]
MLPSLTWKHRYDGKQDQLFHWWSDSSSGDESFEPVYDRQSCAEDMIMFDINMQKRRCKILPIWKMLMGFEGF